MDKIEGFSFPLAVDPITGKFKTTKSLAQDIKQSIYILIMTGPGERVLNKEYGCGINQYLFQEINADMVSRIEQNIYENLMRWEQRIDHVTVEVNSKQSQPEKLLVDISYCIIKTGELGEIKLPLSIMEGVIGNGI